MASEPERGGLPPGTPQAEFLRGNQPVGGATGIPGYDSPKSQDVSPSPSTGQSGRDRPWESDLGFKGLFENLRRLIRVQPVIWEFYRNNVVPMVENEILQMGGNLSPTLNVGGAIPTRNGYIASISVALWNELPASTAVGFRVYRNGNPTRCIVWLTDEDNDGNGCVRAERFNTFPYYSASETMPNGVHDFQAEDRLIFVVESPTNPPAGEGMGEGLIEYTLADNIEVGQVYLEVTYNYASEWMLRFIDMLGRYLSGDDGGGGTPGTGTPPPGTGTPPPGTGSGIGTGIGTGTGVPQQW